MAIVVGQFSQVPGSVFFFGSGALISPFGACTWDVGVLSWNHEQRN